MGNEWADEFDHDFEDIHNNVRGNVRGNVYVRHNLHDLHDFKDVPCEYLWLQKDKDPSQRDIEYEHCMQFKRIQA